MSDRPAYAFGDGVPIEPIDPGTTLLVAGPALSRAEALATSMVADGSGAGHGMLFVSTNTTCQGLLETCRATHPSLDAARTGVIDCTGQDLGQSRFEVQVRTVSTQSDLTGIGMNFSALYESLYATAEGGLVRIGLTSLSSLAMYVDLRALFRFVQTVSGRIESAEGLGLFTIDPTTHDERTVNTLGQAADGRIEVRESDDPDTDGDLRVRGLADHASDWRPFSLPGSD